MSEQCRSEIDIDLSDPKIHSSLDLQPVWENMRTKNSVFFTPTTGTGICKGYWSVMNMDDCRVVLGDHEKFSSEFGTLLNILGKKDPAGGQQMAVTDPPNHAHLRKPLMKAFSRSSIESLIPHSEALVDELFQPLKDGEKVDFAEQTALFSTATASMVLGLPKEDREILTHYTTMCIAPDDPRYLINGDARKTLTTGHRMLFSYFSDKIEERKKNLGSDVLSCLIGIKIDGKPLSSGTILSNCYSLILGANVTTPHVPTSTILKIANGQQYCEWRNMIGKDTRPAIEEALRWASPASHFMRYANHDIVLGGQSIKKGEAVVAWIGSANKDEKAFFEPQKFLVNRKQNKHIAFGYGPHLCVGHVLARQSLRILLDKFVDLFESVEFDLKNTDYLRSNFITGLRSMPIKTKLRRK